MSTSIVFTIQSEAARHSEQWPTNKYPSFERRPVYPETPAIQSIKLVPGALYWSFFPHERHRYWLPFSSEILRKHHVIWMIMWPQLFWNMARPQPVTPLKLSADICVICSKTGQKLKSNYSKIESQTGQRKNLQALIEKYTGYTIIHGCVCISCTNTLDKIDKSVTKLKSMCDSTLKQRYVWL